MHLLQSGVPLVTIKDVLGHADVKSTQVYVEADLEMKRKALDRVGSLSGRRPAKGRIAPSLLKWLESLVESLHSALSSEMLRTDVDCNQEIKVEGAQKLDNGYSDYASWLTWKNGGSSFLRFRLGQRCRKKKLGIAIEKGQRLLNELVIVVNNRDIARPMVGGKDSGNAEIVSLELPDEGSSESTSVVVEFKPLNRTDDKPVDILGFHLR